MTSNLKKVFIVDGLRTPFVKAGKEFASIHPSLLASNNVREFLLKMELRGEEIEELIFGNSFTLPDSSNIARVIALQAGLSNKISATTVSRNCASSMESVVTGMAKIQAGIYESVITGGVESMSQAPLLFSKELSQIAQHFLIAKTFKQKFRALKTFRPSYLRPRISLLEGLKDPFVAYNMGETAEFLAKEFTISKEEQNDFTILSHKKASAGESKLKEELFPVFPSPKYKAIYKDTGPKDHLSKKRLSKFPAYFDKKYGSVTIANSCPINDGSSLLLLMSEDRVKALGLKPLASIVTSSFIGLDPKRMGLGPVYASSLALKLAGLNLKDINLIEINEAFSAQILACLKAFHSNKFCQDHLALNKAMGEIDPTKLNVNGGAIAIGHPISATGTRIILTLAKEMKRQQVEFGLASLCIGGGQGGAIILQNAS